MLEIMPSAVTGGISIHCSMTLHERGRQEHTLGIANRLQLYGPEQHVAGKAASTEKPWACFHRVLSREGSLSSPQTVCCARRRVARSASFAGSEGDVLVPMEAMGEAYNRLGNHGRVGSAIKAGSA